MKRARYIKRDDVLRVFYANAKEKEETLTIAKDTRLNVPRRLKNQEVPPEEGREEKEKEGRV